MDKRLERQWGYYVLTILTPDAFANDPLGFIGNQAAHALIVGGGAWACLTFAGLRRAWAYAAVAGFYALWEAATFQGDMLDAFTDWAFVMAGAALVWAAWSSNRKDMAILFLGVILAGAVGIGFRL